MWYKKKQIKLVSKEYYEWAGGNAGAAGKYRREKEREMKSKRAGGGGSPSRVKVRAHVCAHHARADECSQSAQGHAPHQKKKTQPYTSIQQPRRETENTQKEEGKTSCTPVVAALR